MHTICLTLLLLALSPWGHAQTLYKSVDANGKVVYSDRPAATGATGATTALAPDKNAVNVVSAQPAHAEGKRLPKLQKPDAAQGPAVLYMAQWCGYCRMAKAYMGKRKIAYQEVDVETPAGRAAFAKIRGDGVPVLMLGGQRVDGFTQASYDVAFAARSNANNAKNKP